MPTSPKTNQRPRPPAGRTPPARRAPTAPTHAIPTVLLVLLIVLAIAGGAWLADDETNAVPTPVSTPIPPGGGTTPTAPAVAQPPPTPAPSAIATAVATAAPSPTAATCPERCLVRMIDPTGLLGDALAPRGLLTIYGSDGWLWAAAAPALIDALEAEGRDVILLDETVDTLPLYAVRLPQAGGDEALVNQLGAVLDHVDNQFIVVAATLPPPIDDLISAGIAIEKVPPPRVPRPANGQLPPLTRGVPFRAELSADGLSATMTDLESAGDPAKAETSRYYTERGNVTAAEYLFRRMAGYGLNVWYEDFVADTGAIATNVVGELPGRDTSKTYLVIAHYDSFADGAPAPGADDNASGVAAMLEIARVLSAYELAYPIRFAALTAEEVNAGLQGAKAFATRAATDKVTYAGAINLDALGNPGRDGEIVLNADGESAWLLDLFAAVNADYGVGENLLLRQNPAIVADDTILRDYVGIPTVLVTRAVLGDNPVHHTPEDVLAEANLDGIADVTYLTMLVLADVLSP